MTGCERNRPKINVYYFRYANRSLNGGAKVQVTGHRSQVRSQATGQVTGHRSDHRSGHRPQVTGHRPQVRSQVTQKTIGHSTKLFRTDVLLYKNKISQGTLIFLSFKQY